MSLTKYFAIAIAPTLSQPEKIEAVKKLKDYLESRPDINTGDESYYPVSYAVDPIINGTIDPDKAFQQSLFCAELSAHERDTIALYGFETREVGPYAFSINTGP